MANSRPGSLSGKLTRLPRLSQPLEDRATGPRLPPRATKTIKPGRDDPDAEAREFDKLLEGASILPFLNEALEGKETGGKEHEVRAKLLGEEARAGVVPFEMLLPSGDTEQRADTATTVAAAAKSPGTQAPVLERVFSRSIAARSAWCRCLRFRGRFARIIR